MPLCLPTSVRSPSLEPPESSLPHPLPSTRKPERRRDPPGSLRRPRPPRRPCSAPGRSRVRSSRTIAATALNSGSSRLGFHRGDRSHGRVAPADAHPAGVAGHLRPERGPSAVVATCLPRRRRRPGHLDVAGPPSSVFAIPAGLGDIAVGVAEPRLTRRVQAGHARRATTWFNIFGLADLVTAMALGGLTAYGIVHVSPANSALSQLPLALIPTVGVPTLLALHILTLRRLPGARPSVSPPPGSATPEASSRTAAGAMGAG